MLKFALLASGSKGNCCVIETQQSSIIIDCGSTKTHLLESFKQLNYDYTNCKGLFITHTHSDHISQLKLFQNVHTYAKCPLETDCLHPLSSLDEIQIEDIKVKEIPLSHDAKETSGFVIEDGESKLVYITDTGYIKEEYYPYLCDADYYIFESNHDIEMLMATRRPMYVKQRIIGDLGHLCNEDSASILSRIISEKTKEIVLAHISEEGNSKQRAYEVLIASLQEKGIDYESIRISCAPQFGIIKNEW